MRALVIDDSRAMRMILKGVLVEAGFEVTEAASVREGLERLGEGAPFDVALVDWNLPEQVGIAFVEATRKNPAYNTLKIMMVTTETEMSQMARAIEAGADEYVMKPFTKPALFEKLRLLGLAGS
jgi:two-component system, chemotaxis family, chemotaxis protein CheY